MTLTFIVDRAETDQRRRDAALRELSFGAAPTDHMITIEYHVDRGWHEARVRPYGPFEVVPTSRALHYGQGIFEGMKIFGTEEGGAVAFRPDLHAARFRRSAERMAMPPLPAELFIEALEMFASVDGDWLPSGRGTSLYMRPFMFGTEETLGFRPARQFRFCLFGTPAGSYYDESVGSLSVWVSHEHVRAAPGGTGAAKCVGNYGGSLLAHTRAVAEGCDQVLWLDAHDRAYVEELGGMNVFCVVVEDGETVLRTPPASDTILNGVTRRSVIELAGDLGLRVVEDRLAIADLHEMAQDGRLREMFACGTAAGVAAIGRIKDGEHDTRIGGERTPGAVTSALRERLLDVQHGRVASRMAWLRPLNAGRTR
ncbi:branched-chain amino acid aminotransferase [Actinoallomurus spadix]|uniref:Branched-chain-amino-acid aminotransferase n=1 Tax=Actinoallomurus spadix TaxID=79912 RepID=A0ABP3GMS9_9ACTN|nr:branched-chain amino acid aminotransferase [Actinoallomurus spadix]MCO5989626.1 branched-chain amino acid aminotransferase [Actinoallomurus spadix]